MPYNDDENHSPSEFYHSEQTNDPNEYTAERLAAKAFFGLFYKVTTNCSPAKPYNKTLINLVCSVCTGKYCLRLLANEVNKSLVLHSADVVLHWTSLLVH